MALILPSHAMPFDQEAAKAEIHKRVGDLADIKVFTNRVLVALFIEEGTGLIQFSANRQKESVYQGKVGLVLKVGSLAFENDDHNDFGGASVSIGDWVFFGNTAGLDMSLMEAGKVGAAAEIPCKVLRDVDIEGIIDQPKRIY